jgi:hypothetical protein
MSNYYTFAVRTIVKNSLYAIEYDNTGNDEFQNLFENWSDPEYLDTFFNEHKADLQKDFYNNIPIEEAIIKIINEAEKLEQQLIEYAEKGKANAVDSLQTLFKPLNNYENSIYPIPEYQESKIYGSEHRSWIRIYALRIEGNVFIVTGGAIKLTKTMNEREHLSEELEKLKKVKHFLINEGIIDNDSIVDFMEI